jgi:hypothetical protein
MAITRTGFTKDVQRVATLMQRFLRDMPRERQVASVTRFLQGRVAEDCRFPDAVVNEAAAILLDAAEALLKSHESMTNWRAAAKQ